MAGSIFEVLTPDIKIMRGEITNGTSSISSEEELEAIGRLPWKNITPAEVAALTLGRRTKNEQDERTKTYGPVHLRPNLLNSATGGGESLFCQQECRRGPDGILVVFRPGTGVFLTCKQLHQEVQDLSELHPRIYSGAVWRFEECEPSRIYQVSG